MHTLFSDVDDGRRYGPVQVDVPDWSSVSTRALVVGALAFWLLFRLKWSVLQTLAACVVVGAAIHLAASQL